MQEDPYGPHITPSDGWLGRSVCLPDIKGAERGKHDGVVVNSTERAV
jgi:hypothetical protein